MGERRLWTGLVICGAIGVALAAARSPSVTAHRPDGWQIAGAGALSIAAPAPRQQASRIPDDPAPGSAGPSLPTLGFLGALGQPALFATTATAGPVVAQERSTGASDRPASFSKVVIRPEGGSRLEGVGQAGTDIILQLNGERVERVQVGRDGRWAAVISRHLEPGEHLISATTARANNGRGTAEEEIRVAIPRDRTTGEIVAVDRPERDVNGKTEAEEARRRAEDLARAASERFTELSERGKPPPRTPADAPREQLAQRADDLPATEVADSSGDAPRGGAGPLEAVGGWLEHAEREYREVIVPGLAEPRRVPPPQQVPRSSDWLKPPDVSSVTDWLSRANQTYQREVVGPLTVPTTAPDPPQETPGVKQPARLADEAVEREAARRAEAERRAAERAERLAEDERRRAEQRVIATDEALRREGEQRAAQQRLEAAEEAAKAAERARRQRIEAEIAEAERREKMNALAKRLEAERQAAARREQERASQAAAEAASKAQEERRREAERRAAEQRQRQAEATQQQRPDAEAERAASESRRAGERELQFDTIELKAWRSDRLHALMAQVRRDRDLRAIEEVAAKAALERLLEEKAAKSAQPPPPPPVRPPAEVPLPPSALPELRRAVPEPHRDLVLVPLPEPAPQRPVRFVVEEGSGERGPVLGARNSIRKQVTRGGGAIDKDDGLPAPIVAADGSPPRPRAGGPRLVASGAVCRHRQAGRRIKLPGTYIVQRGDSLWAIAARHYRHGRHYVVIYRANRGRIRNPDMIFPCQRVWLPRLKKRR